MAPSVAALRRLLAADRQGIVGPVVVDWVPVVVGPLVVGSVLVVVASVVVGTVMVVGTVVVGATVVVEPVIGGWVVAPMVENASVIIVVPAVAGTCVVTGPAALVALLTAGGTAAGVGVDRVGAVVGSWGPVGGVGASLGVGSAGTLGSARTGGRRGGGGWGASRVTEATRAARTAVVSPKATSPSLQGHRDAGRYRGRAGRCRGRGVGMGHRPGSTSFKTDAAYWV